MSNFSFALFTDKNFVDCTLFQYGWEKCDPHHSFGPAARNHYLFHYIISGKGLFVSTDSSKKDTEYHLHAGQGFLISPGRVAGMPSRPARPILTLPIPWIRGSTRGWNSTA